MNEYKDNKPERDIPPDLMPLYNIVGDEKYDEIVDIYSGGYIYVPVSERLKRKIGIQIYLKIMLLKE